ncbi:MAG: response regulator [Methanosarcinales archaeon]|nr:MAG: response regulator [Methanosarcinales archaeon]
MVSCARASPSACGAQRAHVSPVVVPLCAVDSIRRLLARAIKRRYPRAVVSMAANGADAVSFMRNASATQLRVHAICMDKEMPVMDGYEATRAIRAAGYTGFMIGVTGNAVALDQAEFMRQGLNALLTKPVDMPALYALLATAASAPL